MVSFQQGSFMHILGFQRQIKRLGSALLLSVIISACRDGSEHEPRPLSETPTEIDDDSDQPIRLSCVCVNRFVMVNDYSVSLCLVCRVAQTGDSVETSVAAADTTRHPAASDQVSENRSTGTLELYMGERRIKARSNAG